MANGGDGKIKRNNRQKTKRGFTLIEILVVIALVGILVGITLVVINVPLQQRRANQGVAKTHIAKACGGYVACLQVQTAANCNSWDNIGVTQPTLPASPYAYTAPTTTAGPTVTGDNCTFTCTATGTITASGTSCLIQ